jgi:hypothetical protein
MSRFNTLYLSDASEVLAELEGEQSGSSRAIGASA